MENERETKIENVWIGERQDMDDIPLSVAYEITRNSLKTFGKKRSVEVSSGEDRVHLASDPIENKRPRIVSGEMIGTESRETKVIGDAPEDRIDPVKASEELLEADIRAEERRIVMKIDTTRIHEDHFVRVIKDCVDDSICNPEVKFDRKNHVCELIYFLCESSTVKHLAGNLRYTWEKIGKPECKWNVTTVGTEGREIGRKLEKHFRFGLADERGSFRADPLDTNCRSLVSVMDWFETKKRAYINVSTVETKFLFSNPTSEENRFRKTCTVVRSNSRSDGFDHTSKFIRIVKNMAKKQSLRHNILNVTKQNFTIDCDLDVFDRLRGILCNASNVSDIHLIFFNEKTADLYDPNHYVRE